MKKLLSFAFLLAAILFAAPQDAYASETIDKILIWKAVPKDYVGQSNVYLHSDENPTGTQVIFDFESNVNEEWDLYRACVEDMSAGNYWVTTTTSEDGLFLDSVGFGFPDMEQKSLVPDIDMNVTAAYIKYYPKAELNNMDTFLNDGMGIPQFFCVFDSADSIENSVKNIESIFLTLFTDYISWFEEKYSHDTNKLLEKLTTKQENYGHFDDFNLLYLPAGYTLYEYCESSAVDFLYALVSNNKTLTVPFWKTLIEHPELPEAQTVAKYNIVTVLKDWGWNIVFDTRNLEYDENGGCITDFTIKEDPNAERKLFFPDLGDDVPKNLPKVGLILDTSEEAIPSTTPDEEIDYGEERFENIPDNENDNKGTSQNPSNISQEEPKEDSSVGIIITVIVLIVILGVVIIVIAKKKK